MSNFDAIEKLAAWSINYQDTCNPWTLYCDLTGYSKDRYGENLNSKNPTLGYIELTQLSDALSVFNGNGYDAVYEYMDKLINSDDEKEEEEEEEEDDAHLDFNCVMSPCHY